MTMILDGTITFSDSTVQNSSSNTYSLGLNQTWQNVTSSRAAGTTYYNTTGKPIEIYLSVAGTNATYPQLTIGSIARQSFNQQLSATAFPFRESGTIPPGSNYQLTASASILLWYELR
jgi:hypothetical protein